MATPPINSISLRGAVENTENSSIAVAEASGSTEDVPRKRKKAKLAEDDGNDCHSAAASAATTVPTTTCRSGDLASDEASAKEDGPLAKGSHGDDNDKGGPAAAATGPTEEDDAEGKAVEVVDSAVLHQNLKDGDRIQVLWTIETTAGDEDAGDDDDADDDDAEEEEDAVVAEALLSTSRWWGATLLPWDGSAEQEVAIRNLRYDAYPPDFPHESVEQVLFAETKDRLLTYPGLEPMIFRREPPQGSGADAAVSMSAASHRTNNGDDDDVIVAGREQVERLVDGILMGALRRNGAAWGTLSASRQAEIAESIAHKKARLLELVETHLESHDVVSAADMRDILARTMEPQA